MAVVILLTIGMYIVIIIITICDSFGVLFDWQLCAVSHSAARTVRTDEL